MRNWMIGAAAALTAAIPGAAMAQSGYAGLVYGNLDIDGVGDEDFYGVEGAVAVPGAVTFELDASYIDSSGGGGDGTGAFTGHLYARNDSHLMGGFLGVTDSDASTSWIGGLEAAKYFERWTLTGAIAYANNDDLDVDGYGLNIEARVFASDNFRLQANAGWANVEFAGSDDDALTFGGGGEYQLSGAPISIAAEYARTEFDTANVVSDAITLALRYNWGGTLRDRDREGASQEGIAGFSL